METIKIIDLLNMTANKEDLPKTILYKSEIYNLNERSFEYETRNEYCTKILYGFHFCHRLNDEVKIISW